MKRLPLLALFIMGSIQAYADHLFGGELYYEHVSGATYKISLALYADCASRSGTAFGALPNAHPVVQIINNQVQTDTLHLHPEETGTEITPVCAALSNSTQCSDLTSTVPGISKFVYSNTITLPVASAGWAFAFNGDLNNNSVAGRSQGITNITKKPSTGTVFILYLKAELNNIQGANTTPKFTSLPTPFYCTNLAQEYNQGAVDSDGDSLSFELAPALDEGNPVIYAPGFSATYPISSQNNLFNFSALNGQMSFTPDIQQKGVVVNKVYEYRNGQVVGSSMREMTFIVLDNCNNTPSEGHLDTSSVMGGVVTAGNIFNVCAGESFFSFSYPLHDADGDTLDISAAGVPAGALLTISNNHTENPSLDFSWNISGVAPGTYTFFATAKDRHCPLSTSQTRGFTVRIAELNEVSHEVLEPTDCLYKAVLEFQISKGLLPRTYTLSRGSEILRTFTDSSSRFVDSLDAGNYTLSVSSKDLLCVTDYHFAVVDSGIFPYTPVFDDPVLCQGEKAIPLDAVSYPDATLFWFDTLQQLLPAAPVPATDSTGAQHWFVAQQYLNCVSAKTPVDVSVFPKPEVSVLHATGDVCLGEKIKLEARGAQQFIWLPEEKIFYEPDDSSAFIRVFKPETYTLVGRDINGCSDTLSFSYPHILPCCRFSYPNVFTPNGDTKNDGWRPVMYGNALSYELLIFNRWGTTLFHSRIPNEAWDGTHEGILQETGTYFYFLKATCTTGNEEMSKGDFLLLR